MCLCVCVGGQLFAITTSIDPLPPAFATNASGHVVSLLKYMQNERPALALELQVRRKGDCLYMYVYVYVCTCVW
jgi:hypothetical protein